MLTNQHQDAQSSIDQSHTVIGPSPQNWPITRDSRLVTYSRVYSYRTATPVRSYVHVHAQITGFCHPKSEGIPTDFSWSTLSQMKPKGSYSPCTSGHILWEFHCWNLSGSGEINVKKVGLTWNAIDLHVKFGQCLSSFPMMLCERRKGLFGKIPICCGHLFSSKVTNNPPKSNYRP